MIVNMVANQISPTEMLLQIKRTSANLTCKSRYAPVKLPTLEWSRHHRPQ